MINALSVCLADGPEAAERADRSMERQGFAERFCIRWEGGIVRAWSRVATRPGGAAAERTTGCLSDAADAADAADSIVHEGGASACCIGPLWYRGRFGGGALRVMLAELDTDGRLDETQLRGSFVLFLRAGSRTWLLNDPLGFARVYRSGNGRYFGTSWLAARAYSGDAALDGAAMAEYVLLGACHSDSTVASGVSKLPLGRRFDLSRGIDEARFGSGLVPPDSPVRTMEEAVVQLGDHLGTVFDEAAAAFPGRIRSALSGGFDSRLIVAGLLASGARPVLFVYGGAASSDVVVSKQVAEGMGLSLQVIDKAALDRELPEPGVEELVQNALFFDGLPNDGVLDRGSDRRTRLGQASDGMLAMNGGGGEILRNFFHLPDRSFSARDLVRSFYRGFDARVFRRSSSLREYEERLAASIDRSLTTAGATARYGSYDRAAVELVYPLFRCHHWMGLNNSVALRDGYFVTPLVDVVTVRLACRLPLAWKNAGALESRLITHLHPKIAAYASAYGFPLHVGPGARARLSEWLTRMRPVAARPWVNALARRVRGQGVARGRLERLRASLPGEWRVDSRLDVSRLPDESALARAASIEVLDRFLRP